MNSLCGTDAYSPDEIAEQIEEVGVTLGNLVSGAGMVGLVALVINRRGRD